MVRENSGQTMKDQLNPLENELIAEALARFNGNKKKAAGYLKVTRFYLYKKLGE